MTSNDSQNVKWQWLDDQNTWQPYDAQTNHQIERAYNKGVISIKLTKGPYFGRYENQIYYVIFDSAQCTQINKQTRRSRKVKRELALKTNKKKKSVVQTNEITKTLTQFGFDQKVIKKAMDIFNTKYDVNALNKYKMDSIIDAIMDIVQTICTKEIKDDEKKEEKQNEAQHQDPYNSSYDAGSMIEINIGSTWIPAEIKKTKALNKHGHHVRNRVLYVEYKDSKSGATISMTLHGLKDKNKFRALGSGLMSDDHSFAFKYAPNDKKNIAKNAKHPAAYINRPCFYCKGTGDCGGQRRGGHGGCNKCHGTGIFKKKHSMNHDKCHGLGCDGCQNSGRYPLQDWKCKSCNGSGHRAVSRDGGKQCLGGYFLPKLVQFRPERNGISEAHGQSGSNNTIRLYHTTNKHGRDGILSLGVMFRGESGSYGAGIYFAPSAKVAKQRARQSGYLVIADVFVGRCMDTNDIMPEMDFPTINKLGYDSISGNWSGEGKEYCIYNWDQVWVHIIVGMDKVNLK